MKKETAIIGAGLAIIGVVILATRAKAEPPPEETGATIVIEVYDAAGNPVAKNSPRTLDEGSSYIVRLTVKNTSTKAGVPWAATLGIGISAGTNFVSFIPGQIDQEKFSAGQIRSFDFPMDVPLATAGQAGGVITAWVEDPTGYVLATAEEDLTITEVPIDYGATIVIG